MVLKLLVGGIFEVTTGLGAKDGGRWRSFWILVQRMVVDGALVPNGEVRVQPFNDLRIQGKGTDLAIWVETKVAQNTKLKATA